MNYQRKRFWEGTAIITGYMKLKNFSVFVAIVMLLSLLMFMPGAVFAEDPVLDDPVDDFRIYLFTATTAAFNWTSPTSGVTDISIEQSTDGGGSWDESASSNLGLYSHTATVTGLTSGTEYQFRLVITGGDKVGESNVVTLTTDLAGTISGKVTESDGTTPISGVTVSVFKNEWMPAGSTFSDAEGSYSLTDVPAETECTIEFEKEGYPIGIKEVNIEAGKNTVVDISLTSDNTAPVLSDGRITEIGKNEAFANFTSDEDGSCDHVVLTADTPAPTVEEIRNHESAVTWGGYMCVADRPRTAHINNLEENTAYIFYVIVEDEVKNVSEILSIPFTTSLWAADDYPAVGTIQADGSKKVGVKVKSNRAGTAYYVVDGYPIPEFPTVDEIMAGKDGYGLAAIHAGSLDLTADTEAEFVTNTLPKHSAEYNVYVVIKEGNNSSQVRKVDVITPEAGTGLLLSTTPIIPGAKVGVPYSGHDFTNNVSGGGSPYRFAIGNPPDGFSLDGSVLRGTPTEYDPNCEFSVTVTDKEDNFFTETFNLVISPADLKLNGGTIDVATQGIHYEFQFGTVTAGGTDNRTWEISSGSVPSGLAINSIGYLTGIPTVHGEFNFEITVTDDWTPKNTATASYRLIVNPSSAKAITAFNFETLDPHVVGSIDEESNTIALTVPFGTDVTALVPTIVHTGKSISPAMDATDFTNPVTYTVTAEDDTSASYTVSVTIADAIPVTSLTVTAAGDAISVKKGQTLQMIATALPVEASDKTVTWSVENGTGSATINTNGLLTGTGAGTVTVKATANDASGIVGEKDITITAVSSGGGGGGSSPGTTIDSNGGTVKDDGAKVVFPKDAVDNTIKVTIARRGSSGLTIPEGYRLVSSVFDIVKNKSGDFDKYVTVTLPFDRSKLDQEKDELAIYWLNGSKWIILDNIKVDWSAGTVSGTIDHFTKFAVLAKAKAVAEPGVPGEDDPGEPEVPTVTLNDITGHWAEDAIRSLVAAGAISGYSDGSFQPNRTVTRAEFAQILVKAMEIPAVEEGKVFPDTANHWAKESIAAAYAAGIITGYGDDRFGPNDLVTREQIAAMVVRAAKLTGPLGQLNFVDTNAISDWAREDVSIALANNLITGHSDNTFRPKNSATRAEAATIIYRTID